MLLERGKERRKEAWCFRNVINHPVDPAWERGAYCLCHEPERKQIADMDLKHIEYWIFDVVQPRNQDYERYIIRSAFRVIKREAKCFWRREGGRGPDLIFKDFFFVKPSMKPLPVPSRYQNGQEWNGKVQTGIHLTPKEASRLRNKITDTHRYERLAKEQIPSRVATTSWRAMKSIAGLGSKC
jgi:hypothetical protein